MAWGNPYGMNPYAQMAMQQYQQNMQMPQPQPQTQSNAIIHVPSEEEGYSGYYYDDADMSMARGGRGGRSNRGGSYARRGGSYERGRSNRRGYARMESRDEFMDEIEELMEKAPDEATRKKFERFLSEMK